MSQQKRQKALDGFKNGSYNILVATDIAARGIDVAGISHIINYDIPGTTEAYTHRAGRTGRANQSGETLTFTTSEDFKMIRNLERALGEKLIYKDTAKYDTKGPAPEKTHLQNTITATATNILRMMNWLNGVSVAQTRISSFAALAA